MCMSLQYTESCEDLEQEVQLLRQRQWFGIYVEKKALNAIK